MRGRIDYYLTFVQKEPNTPDVMSALLKPYNGAKPSGAGLRMLEGDAQLIIVAGRLV